MLGRPGVTWATNIDGLESWDYAAVDSLRNVIINVTFDADGRVKTAGELTDPADQSLGDGRAHGRR